MNTKGILYMSNIKQAEVQYDSKSASMINFLITEFIFNYIHVFIYSMCMLHIQDLQIPDFQKQDKQKR